MSLRVDGRNTQHLVLISVLTAELMVRAVAERRARWHARVCAASLRNSVTYVLKQSHPASQHARLVSKKSHNEWQCEEQRRPAGG